MGGVTASGTLKGVEGDRKVIKPGKKGLRVNYVRELQERALLDRLKKKGDEEYQNFDITLSGCSATLMI